MMYRILLIGLLSLLNVGQALAQGTQTFTKSLLSPGSIERGEPVSYRFDFACSSLVADCGALNITDTLPAELEVLSCTAPSGFTVVSCSGNTIQITRSPYLDGDGGSVTINAVARVEAAVGVPIINTGVSTITSGPGGNPDVISSDANPVIINPPVANYIVRKRRTNPAPPLNPAADTDVEYQLQLCAVNGIGNADLNNAMLLDTYPPGATVVFADGGVDDGTTVTWDLGDIDISTLYATASTATEQCVSRNLVLFFPSGAFPLTTAIPNTVDGSGTPGEGPGIGFGPGNDTATVDDVISVATPGANMSKVADDVLSGGGEGPLVYRLNANINSSNVPVTDLTFYESIPQTPAGLFPLQVTSGQWNSPTNSQGASNVRMTLSTSNQAISDSNSVDCAAVAYGVTLDANIASGAVITYNLVGDETCIRWQFNDASALPSAPAVPRGWRFTNPPRITLDTQAVAGPFPVTIQNCMFASFDDLGFQTDGPVCGIANIEDPTPEINARKIRLGPAGNLVPATDVQYRLTFNHVNARSTGPVIDPIISDLLPPEFDFVSWNNYNFAGGPQPDPNFEVIEDYLGSGRTLVRFTWTDTPPVGSTQIDGSPAVANGASFDESIANGDMPQIDITVRVAAGTAPGSYTNEVAFFDNSPLPATCTRDRQESTQGLDLSGDGDAMDRFCQGSNNFTVVEAAVLGGQKFVRGDQDPARPNVDDPTSNPAIVDSFCEGAPNDYTRFPCVAQTDQGGNFNYELRLVNDGNVLLTDYVLYDVLPVIGDTGVGPALSGSARESTWRPNLTGPVTFTSGLLIDEVTPFAPAFTVTYSTALNPCRNELSDDPTFPLGCDNTYVPAPANFSVVTAFRLEMPYPAPEFWPSGATVNFNVPMSAPVDAPPSIPGNAAFFNPAWNNFAHRVREQSTSLLLPTAEPRKVGIITPPAYRLGNLVWLDLNHDGLAQAAEPGLQSVRVEARVDDDGTAGPSAGDSIAGFDTTDPNGNYLIPNLDAGQYYLLIPEGQNGVGQPLENLYQSTRSVEINPNADADNNMNGDLVVAGLGLVSGLIDLGPADSEPANEVDRLGGPDDDSDNFPDSLSNVSVDFGYFRPFSLGNRVWLDQGVGAGNTGFNNGLREAGEPGVNGITVNLLDGSGAPYDADPVAGGVQQPTTLTANDGYYLFENLVQDDYCVELDLTGGFENLTSSTGSNGNSGPFEPGVDPEVLSSDDDDNGTQVSPTIIRCTSVTLGTSLTPAEPLLEADLDATLTNGQGSGPDGTPLSDAQGNMTVDFGLFETYSLGNQVWLDLDDSGLIDNAEAGINGVDVSLFEDFDLDGNPDGAALSTVLTASNGFYRFDNLIAGDYIVEVITPLGFASSTPDAGDPDVDEDENDDNGVIVDLVAGTVRSNPITLGLGGSEPVGDIENGPGDPGAVDDRSNLTVDFGFTPVYSLGNRVFGDLDNSGTLDVGEPGIDNITVNLYRDTNDDGTPDGGIIAVDTTMNGGYYRFDNLGADTYIVECGIPAGMDSSDPDAGDPDADVDDSDDNGVILSPDFVRTNPVTLGPGDMEPGGEADLSPTGQGSVDGRANMTVDCGFFGPVYDLALRKTLAVGQSPNVDSGDEVTFTISVFNQSNTIAAQINLIDYIPDGFELADSDWMDQGNQTATFAIPGSLLPDVTMPAVVDITLRVTDAAVAGEAANFAEILSFMDDEGNVVIDIDSSPDGMDDNDPGGQPGSPADDSIDGNGGGMVGDGDPVGDEDDHDPALVFVEVFDLSLLKDLASGQDPQVAIGQLVNFTITVTNEGNVDAANVAIVDYIPRGLRLEDPDWTDNGDDTASITLPGVLAAGTSTSVEITMLAVNLSVGGEVQNRAEIESATDGGGDPRDDIDSDPDNDTDGEDDIDPVSIFLPPLIIPVNAPWAILLMVMGMLWMARRRLTD